MKNLPIKKHSSELSLANTKNLLSITNKLLNTSLIPSPMRYRIYVPTGNSCINTIAITADGKYIISGDSDYAFKLYDIQTGDEVQSYQGHTNTVDFVAIVNKKFILSYSRHNAKLYNFCTGEEIWTKEEDSQWSSPTIATSPDGKYIITCNNENILILWDSMSGKKLRAFPEKKLEEELEDNLLSDKELQSTIVSTTTKYNYNTPYEIRPVSVTITADNKYVVSGYADFIIRLWDLKNGIEVKTFEGHHHDVNFVSITTDGKYMFSISNYTSMKLWDFGSGEEIWSVPISTSIESAAITADGKYIILAEYENKLKLLDLQSAKEMWSTDVGDKSSNIVNSVNAITITADGKYIVSGSHNGDLKLWNLQKGKEIWSYRGYSLDYDSRNISIYEKYVVLGNEYGILKLWNWVNGKIIWTCKGHDDSIESIAITKNGEYIVSGSLDKTVKLWDLKSGKEIRTFEGHELGVTAVAVSRGGKYIISGDEGGNLNLWDLNNGEGIWTFQGHTGSVYSVIITADDKYFFSTGTDSTLELWDIDSSEHMRSFWGYEQEAEELHHSAIIRAVITSDGKYLVTGGLYASTRIWNLQTAEQIYEFPCEEKSWSMEFLAMTADDKYLISADSGSLTLWDFGSRKRIWTTQGSLTMVNSLAITKDEKYIITSGGNGIINIWDLLTGKEIAKYVIFEDGEWLYSTSEGDYNCSSAADKYFYFIDDSQCIPKILEKDHPVYKHRKKDILLENY